MIWVRRVFEGDWACRCLGEEVRYSRQTGIGPPAFPTSGIWPPQGSHSLFRLPRGIGLALTGCTFPPSSPEGHCINEPVCLLHTFFFVFAPPVCKQACTGGVKTQKNRKIFIFRFISAEREGFEPPDPLRSTVFKTAAIDHSATSPSPPRLLWDCKGRNYFCISKFIFKKIEFFCKIFSNLIGKRDKRWPNVFLRHVTFVLQFYKILTLTQFSVNISAKN